MASKNTGTFVPVFFCLFRELLDVEARRGLFLPDESGSGGDVFTAKLKSSFNLRQIVRENQEKT